MAVVRLFFSAERIGPQFERVGQAAFRAAREAADDVLAEGILAGRANIAAAPGQFGPRWVSGLFGNVTTSGGNINVNFRHEIPYFWVHQEGATIRGKPLMWIPMIRMLPGERFTNTFFQWSRAGNLILFQKLGPKTIMPLRVAKESVFVPKRFAVVEELIKIMREYPNFYRRRFAEQQRG